MNRITCTILITFALAGCAREEQPSAPAPVIVPTEVIVMPATLDLAAGSGGQLAAQSNDGAGQPIGGAPITYAAETPVLLQVSDSGYVSSLGPAGLGYVSVISGSTARKVEVRIHPGEAVKLSAVTAITEPGQVGKPLPGPVQVQALDGYGNPVPGASVQFEATTAGSAVDPPVATTDAAGLADTAWTLGTVAGPQTLRASVTGAATLVVNVPAGPGLPELLEPTGTMTEVLVAGTNARPSVIVRDSFGNVVPGVPVAWSVAGSQSRVLVPVSNTSESGIAETEVATAPAAGLATVVATLTERSNLSATIPITTVAGPAAAMAIKTGNRQTAAAGAPVKLPPTVLVADANGNPVSGAVVTFAVAAGDGSVEGDVQTTDAAGLASAGRWILGSAGKNELRATVPGITDGVAFAAEARRAR